MDMTMCARSYAQSLWIFKKASIGASTSSSQRDDIKASRIMPRTTRAAAKRKHGEDPNGSNAQEIHVVTERVSKQNAARNKRAAKRQRRRRALGTLTINKRLAARKKDTPKSYSPSSDYLYTGKVDDIDERDAENPLCVTEYVQDIFEHFRRKETSTVGSPCIHGKSTSYQRTYAFDSCRLAGGSSLEVQARTGDSVSHRQLD